MELSAAGLQEQPFRTHGRPLVFVAYAGQEAAFDFFERTYGHKHGLGLFQGPSLSGKTTLMRQFAELQEGKYAVAVIDGAGLNTTTLLEAMLSQFGFEHKFNTVNELINMLRVFTLQQASSDKPPLLFVENSHAMNPSAMRILCELAGLRHRGKYALRMILASDHSIDYIVSAPAMELMAKRLTGSFHLTPLTLDETTGYMYAKMRSGGCFDPENVFPDEVCAELYACSGGWPGIVDRLALLALANAEYCPVRKESIERPVVPSSTEGIKMVETKDADQEPILFLTLHGQTLKKITFDQPRVLIGRADHNDICIDSNYVSRHHALLVRHGKATLLMDLNSSNGTLVNSRRVSNQVLVHDDIITIGNHGIKFIHPVATDRSALEDISLSDTVVMKSLEDMRKILARENTQILPTADLVKKSGSE